MTPVHVLLHMNEQWLQQAVVKGWLAEAELAAAATKAQADRTGTAAVLLAAKKLTEEQIAALKAAAAGAAVVEVGDYLIDPPVLQLIPEALARKHQVLPLYRIDSALTVAMADPWDAVAVDALRAATRLPIINPVVSTPTAIRKAIDHHYSRRVMEQAARPAAQHGGAEAAAAAGPDFSAITLVDALLGEALDSRASDIHLEPDGEHLRVRFRIDGVLQEIKLLPIALHEAVCSRIKILSKLDITEHRQPQDGHLVLPVGGRHVDLRISTYPTVSGENVVLRLLDQASVALKLADLGFAADTVTAVGELIQRPHGMLLVTGPTGSGKTTTLYAALTQINSMSRNLMTIEDPVEYQLPLIRQTQIQPKAGLTFATGLRAILRQDPDVIMVGEIRDQETAEIAIHASLTGHLVLSTLHTNDAVGAIARLLDMRVEPFLLSSTLLGVLGQRLVRRICAQCQEGARLPEPLRAKYPELTVAYRGRGCRACRTTGFTGRIAIGELFVISDSIRPRIAQRTSTDILTVLAREQGMRTMRADGLLKVQQGLTTIEELDRVVPADLA